MKISDTRKSVWGEIFSQKVANLRKTQSTFRPKNNHSRQSIPLCVRIFSELPSTGSHWSRHWRRVFQPTWNLNVKKSTTSRRKLRHVIKRSTRASFRTHCCFAQCPVYFWAHRRPCTEENRRHSGHLLRSRGHRDAPCVMVWLNAQISIWTARKKRDLNLDRWDKSESEVGNDNSGGQKPQHSRSRTKQSDVKGERPMTSQAMTDARVVEVRTGLHVLCFNM